MSEKQFNKELRTLLKPYGHVSMVESGATAAGVPDLDYCLDGVEGHIELKYAFGGDSYPTRTTQMAWFRNRVKAGGKPFIMTKWEEDKNRVVQAIYRGEKFHILHFLTKPIDWLGHAIVVWDSSIDIIHLIRILKHERG